MEWLFTTLIGNSVIACAIALLALLALLLRRPALAHVLWLLVLVKLVTPPVVRVQVTVPWQRGDAPALAQIAEPAAAAIVDESHSGWSARSTGATPMMPVTPGVMEPPAQTITARS